jgi:hypothetical protein
VTAEASLAEQKADLPLEFAYAFKKTGLLGWRVTRAMGRPSK